METIKYLLHFIKDPIYLISFLAIIFCSILLRFLHPSPEEVAKAKELASCRMIEENINNGFFSENTNKLDCNGVIKNVPVSDYKKALDIIGKSSG